MRAAIRGGLVLATAAVASLALTTTGATGAKSKTVTLQDDFFSPSALTVKKGTKVKFRWAGDNPHNVVKRKGPGGKFRSDTTSSNGVNFKKKFKRKGTYKLVCTIHASDGMKMKLKVR